LLTTVGLCGAFYGVLVGITQSNPKTVLAYSSVSQMGFLAAVLGMGLSAGDSEAGPIAALYGAHHVLVKGALFLAVGVAASTGTRRMGIVLVPGVLIGLGLAGLPLTGGALAKLAAKAPIGYGLAGTVATWSAAGTALLMLHFLRCVSSTSAKESHKNAPFALVAPWLTMAVFCVFLPWAYYPSAGLGSFSDALAPAIVWKTLWPVLAGLGLFFGLGHWFHRLPAIPCGDVVVLGRGTLQVATACGSAIAKVDGLLRLWTAACLSLLVIIVALLAAMFTRS
jgi:multicomponent Na+:H+ antiporter subunit A